MKRIFETGFGPVFVFLLPWASSTILCLLNVGLQTLDVAARYRFNFKDPKIVCSTHYLRSQWSLRVGAGLQTTQASVASIVVFFQ